MVGPDQPIPPHCPQCAALVPEVVLVVVGDEVLEVVVGIVVVIRVLEVEDEELVPDCKPARIP